MAADLIFNETSQGDGDQVIRLGIVGQRGWLGSSGQEGLSIGLAS